MILESSLLCLLFAMHTNPSFCYPLKSLQLSFLFFFIFSFLETNWYAIFSDVSNVCCLKGLQQGNLLEFIANRDAKNASLAWPSLSCELLYILGNYCNILRLVSCLLQRSINYKFLMAVNVFLGWWSVYVLCLIFTLNFLRDVIFGNKLPL